MRTIPREHEHLVERFLPLARSLAMGYARSSQPIEDLLQVASVGLVKAAARFDPERGVSFRAFATPTILGELRRHFRDFGWTVRVPRGLQERTLAASSAIDDLTASLGRAPSIGEIAGEIGTSTEDVVEALEASHASHPDSLDRPAGEEATWEDTLGRPDESFDVIDWKLTLMPALEALPESQRTVVGLRFFGDLSQAQIAERIGVSQMQVSRLLRRSLKELRDAIGAPS